MLTVAKLFCIIVGAPLIRAISEVLESHFATLQDIVEPQTILRQFAGRLRGTGIANKAVTRNPNFNDIIDIFTSALYVLDVTGIEKHCQNFTGALSELGGIGAVQCANILREEWRAAAKYNGYNYFMQGMTIH